MQELITVSDAANWINKLAYLHVLYAPYLWGENVAEGHGLSIILIKQWGVVSV